jgi:dihydroorotate dehydrogenase electron transfer subunit
MLQARAKILYNKKVKGNYFRLIIRSPRITKESSPGQFLNIKVNDADEPLLRRPFSIHSIKGANLEILYEVLGPGTEILSKRTPPELLDVIGPLGNGFNLPKAIYKALPLLVAGGMGVAPLVFLADRLVHSPQCPSVHRKLLVLIGAKTRNQILCEREFGQLGCNVKISTNDGSRGFKGKVTELLKYLLSTMDYGLLTIYACGPRPMLEEINQIAQKHKIPAQVSLEEHMACGIGACLGCVVNTKEGFKRVCKEGPVFKVNEIIW